MRIRLFTIAVAALLLAFVVAPNSMAKVSKAKVTFSTPVYLGQASLAPASSAPSSPSGPRAQVEMDPRATGHPKGAAAPSGAEGPAVPTPGTTFPIAPGAGARNVDWNALNNADSRNVNGFDLEPPDQGLCVGNGFVIEPINLVMAFYDQAGNLYVNPGKMSMNHFFLEPAANFLSDPRCYYDTNDQRFFITILVIDNGTGPGPYRSHLDIAVSNDNNPLHGFGMFAIDTTDDGSDGTPLHFNCPCFGDQPLIGADAFGFYITTNEFSLVAPVYNEVQIYAISKSLLEGFVLGTVVHFNNVDDPSSGGATFSIHPSIAPDVGGSEPAGGTEFLLACRDYAGFATGSETGATSVAVWAATGTSTLVNAFPSLTLSEKVVTTEAYNIPPNAQQKGSSNQLQTDDDRMQQVMFEGGLLQAALSTGFPVGCPSGSSSTCANPASASPAVAWFVIQPTITGATLSGATKIKNGYVVGPTVSGNHTSLMYPALAVNKSNLGIISFSLTQPGVTTGFFPSTAYIHYSESKGPYGSIQVVAKGVAPENGFTCSPCRWGDYSWAILDDLNPAQMWLATENIDGVANNLALVQTGGDPNWSTHVAAVKVP
jgi:hypothetical protein